MPREAAPAPDRPLAGRGLTRKQERQLAALLDLLESDEHAPTSVRDATRAARMHLADSLSALDLEPVRAADQIADLGSGAGFPGLALAVALPRAHVSLVESQRRRCEFLERMCVGGPERAGGLCARRAVA